MHFKEEADTYACGTETGLRMYIHETEKGVRMLLYGTEKGVRECAFYFRKGKKEKNVFRLQLFYFIF